MFIDDRSQTAAFFFLIWKEAVKDGLNPSPHDPKISFEQAPENTREVFFVIADKFNTKMDKPHNRDLLARQLHRFWARMSLHVQNTTTRPYADLVAFTKIEWYFVGELTKQVCRTQAAVLYKLQEPKRTAA